MTCLGWISPLTHFRDSFCLPQPLLCEELSTVLKRSCAWVPGHVWGGGFVVTH